MILLYMYHSYEERVSSHSALHYVLLLSTDYTDNKSFVHHIGLKRWSEI